LLTIGSSLAVVLGLFFLFAWTMRRGSPGGSAVLPGEVVEVLGRAPLTHRQQLHLLRCGRKLVLVNVCAEGVETLTEITEPEEVDRLLGLCRQSHPQSASATFRQVFQQFAGKDA
jgi:flagellar biogenesis protein FliO